mmetsp:Transcript_55285/g.66556  ORF Transcript_55285/g.66556 Transcript_55285/m.66556 type:complete len:99 (+) Transcript_55285:582-878(+)
MNSALYPYFPSPETGELWIPPPLRMKRVICVDGNVRADVILLSINMLWAGVMSRGTRYFEIVTPRVRVVARNQFDCQSLEGAGLENRQTNTEDCFGSH